MDENVLIALQEYRRMMRLQTVVVIPVLGYEHANVSCSAGAVNAFLVITLVMN